MTTHPTRWRSGVQPWLALVPAAGLAAVVVLLGDARGQQVHRNSFEAREIAWQRGAADVAFRETAHEVTDQAAHSGQFAEHLQLTAEKGSYLYYVYPTGRAPVNEELSLSVWVKANRPGAQLCARLVLPKERNPKNIEEPLTTTLRGDPYQLAGRWQRLEVRRPEKLAKEQQQLMRAELQRDVDFTDAYVDRLQLNVYGGPGLNELWLDDLEVGPVLDDTPFKLTSRPIGPRQDTPLPAPKAAARAVVELSQDQLRVGGRPFFFRGIRHSDTPLKVLRDAGLNTVWVDYATSPALLQEAVDLGFWLVPALPVTREESRLASSEALLNEVGRFREASAVLFWDLGSALVAEQAPFIGQAALALKGADAQRPVAADVWDGFRPYSRSLDLVGVHRWPLMTSLELPQYITWLQQRRLLARPGAFLWTWVQTHLPDWYLNTVYGKGEGEGFDEPIGPQPEQLTLLSYVALAAGCRGLAFWSDRFLADSHHGRDRLLALALLNLELQMLEPMLVTAEPPRWVTSTNPDVLCAVIRTEKGMLVLPMWLGRGAQYVPGQLAAYKLECIVPEVPSGARAWLVTPGEARSLKTERVTGGTKFTMPEFGLTGAVVFTGDTGPNGLVVRFQDFARRKRQLAAQWSYDLARVELEKVEKVQSQLEAAGHSVSDAAALLDNARSRLRTCREHWENGLYAPAYAEAQRAVRPLRLLMRAQWELAIRELDTVVASPYALSFFTLPRHWQFLDQVGRSSAGATVLPDGDFEQAEGLASEWVPQETTIDDVKCVMRRVRVATEEQEDKEEAKAAADKDGKTDKESADDDEGKAHDWPDELNVTTPAGNDEEMPAVKRKAKRRTDKLPPPPAPRKHQTAPDAPKVGEQCLALQVIPKGPPPSALERTFLALNSPAVRLQPGSLVRISFWTYMPSTIVGSADGALVFDSAGGEPLAVRLPGPTWGERPQPKVPPRGEPLRKPTKGPETIQPDWKKYTVYRRVPASGTLSVTLALTGIGTVYFDKVRVEPLQDSGTAQR